MIGRIDVVSLNVEREMPMEINQTWFKYEFFVSTIFLVEKEKLIFLSYGDLFKGLTFLKDFLKNKYRLKY